MFNISKKIAGIALGVSLLGVSAAQASVPQESLVVGGIEYGDRSPMSEVSTVHRVKLRRSSTPSMPVGRQLNGSTATILTLSL